MDLDGAYRERKPLTVNNSDRFASTASLLTVVLDRFEGGCSRCNTSLSIANRVINEDELAHFILHIKSSYLEGEWLSWLVAYSYSTTGKLPLSYERTSLRAHFRIFIFHGLLLRFSFPINKEFLLIRIASFFTAEDAPRTEKESRLEIESRSL